MAVVQVGPNSLYASIADAMLVVSPGDIISLESGYRNETVTVTQTGITIDGDATSTGIVLQLANGIPNFTTTGSAPFQLLDAADGNGLVGNSGDNVVTVTAGADAVDGGAGTDRLVVEYSLATGAVTGDSTAGFAEAGGGGRLVTITSGTFEHFTVLTGVGADTLTTYDGDDIIKAGKGANTVTAGQGANIVVTCDDADVVTALDGGNHISVGDGANTVTTGDGDDTIYTGVDADTITTGGGGDLITVRGGADTVVMGEGNDRLIVSYSAMTTSVTGTITAGALETGYVGVVADLAANSIGFTGVENFTVTLGSGDDLFTTAGGADKLRGNAGADTLDGGAGLDTLLGGAGADALTGGLGADRLAGGAGADRFIFVTANDSTLAQLDNITDFERGIDRLDLSTIDADPDIGGNQAFAFLGASGFTGAGSEVRYEQVGHRTIVSADLDGDLLADFVVQLNGAGALTASDIVL